MLVGMEDVFRRGGDGKRVGFSGVVHLARQVPAEPSPKPAFSSGIQAPFTAIV